MPFQRLQGIANCVKAFFIILEFHLWYYISAIFLDMLHISVVFDVLWRTRAAATGDLAVGCLAHSGHAHTHIWLLSESAHTHTRLLLAHRIDLLIHLIRHIPLITHATHSHLRIVLRWLHSSRWHKLIILLRLWRYRVAVGNIKFRKIEVKRVEGCSTSAASGLYRRALRFFCWPSAWYQLFLRLGVIRISSYWLLPSL